MVDAWASTGAAMGLAWLIGMMVNRWLEKFERQPQWWPPFSE